MTKNQEIIFKTIEDSGGHLTADEIYMHCRDKESRMSIATVYRNLGIMVEKKMIAKIYMSGHTDYYDCNTVKHEHIFCGRCGKMTDAHIEGLKAYLEDKTGIQLEAYDLCMRYICQECRTKYNKQQN
ncbi:MAG: transcriptional repressor [Lachnospiraceae bacterium]|nr:transcriptional repressor [Lachnospiraceae bacterium]